jgi:hypothetical protein
MGIDYFAANPSNDSVRRLVALRSCHDRACHHDSILRDSKIG